MELITSPFGSFGHTLAATIRAAKETGEHLITIPNGTVMAEEIVNFSAAPTRRVDMVFSLPYRADPVGVREILLSVARDHPLVLSDPAVFCRLTEQGEDGLRFTLRAWVKRDDYWSVKFDLLEAAHSRLSDIGLSPPYRQMDVHLGE